MATAGSEVPGGHASTRRARGVESAIIVTDLAGTIQSCNPTPSLLVGPHPS